MSDTRVFLTAIRRNIERMLEGEISEREFVKRYEDLMADHLPDEIDQSGTVHRLLDDYWMQFSFFQNDPEIRAAGPDDLYGPEELRVKAQALLKHLKRFQREETP